MLNRVNILHYRAPPAGTEKRIQWVSAIETHQEVGIHTSQILVCENHFEEFLIQKRKDRNILQKGAVPSIFPDSLRYIS